MKLPLPLKVFREAAAAASAAASAWQPLGPPAGRGGLPSLLPPLVDACPLLCGRPSLPCLSPLSFLQIGDNRHHLLKTSSGQCCHQISAPICRLTQVPCKASEACQVAPNVLSLCSRLYILDASKI